MDLWIICGGDMAFSSFLPARTPEWNPMELLWNALVQRLKLIPLCVLRDIQQDATAHAAHFVLTLTTHEEVDSNFTHLYEILPIIGIRDAIIVNSE
eukprot:CCRYP_012308-RA/>CCRYP_012308-RA protein AED:0.50 eAED:0.50 QI:0/0/0/0.5/1/1/2/0/95